jgi:hypothetical protein
MDRRRFIVRSAGALATIGLRIGGREAAGIATRGASKCQPECRRTRDGSSDCDRVRGTHPRGQISDRQEASRSLR